MHLAQDALILLDVLQHVECTNHVKFICKRDISGVHLHKIDRRQSGRGEPQPGREYLASMKRRSREVPCYAR